MENYDELNELVYIEDALDAMSDGSECTKEEYIAMHKAYVREEYAKAWEEALILIDSHDGGIKEAKKAVKDKLEVYR